jgi:hypothetical protein
VKRNLGLLVAAICSTCGPRDQGREAHNPTAAAPAAEFATKNKCADRADAFLRLERSKDPSDAFIRGEEFTYSRPLNTCLLYFEVAELGAGTTYNIVDTLTNRRLYHSVRYLDRGAQELWDKACKPEDGCLSEGSLQKRHAELFDKQGSRQ